MFMTVMICINENEAEFEKEFAKTEAMVNARRAEFKKEFAEKEAMINASRAEMGL